MEDSFKKSQEELHREMIEEVGRLIIYMKSLQSKLEQMQAMGEKVTFEQKQDLDQVQLRIDRFIQKMGIKP